MPRHVQNAGVDYIEGPSSSTDNAIVRWDSTDGNILQDSTPTISDAGVISVDTLAPLTDTTFTIDLSGTTDKRMTIGDASFRCSSIESYANGQDLTLLGLAGGKVVVNDTFSTNSIQSIQGNDNLTLAAQGNGVIQLNDDMKWLSTWNCEVKIASAQTLTTGTDTLIVFNSVVLDPSSLNSSGVITLAKGGVYIIMVTGYLSAAGTGTFYADLRRNGTSGTNQIAATNGNLAVSYAAPRFNLVYAGVLTAADVIRFYMRHDNGSDLNLSVCNIKISRIYGL